VEQLLDRHVCGIQTVVEARDPRGKSGPGLGLCEEARGIRDRQSEETSHLWRILLLVTLTLPTVALNGIIILVSEDEETDSNPNAQSGKQSQCDPGANAAAALAGSLTLCDGHTSHLRSLPHGFVGGCAEDHAWVGIAFDGLGERSARHAFDLDLNP